MKLALGTVQFGLPYGITNRAGQVPRAEVAAILALASASGIETLDTAIAYGESERCLGQIGISRWRVVTKLPAAPPGIDDIAGWVGGQVADSLGRLQIGRLHGLLLHSPDQLLGHEGIALFQALVALKQQGKVDKIGVSIYDPQQLDALWPHFKFDLVQAPFNVFDRRLAKSGWLARLREAGVEVHVRSIFLQGLLAQPAAWPPQFDRWQALRKRWSDWLAKCALSPLEGCVGFALSWPEIDRVVIGIESAQQLREILVAAAGSPVVPPDEFASEDMDLINPAHWNVAA